MLKLFAIAMIAASPCCDWISNCDDRNNDGRIFGPPIDDTQPPVEPTVEQFLECVGETFVDTEMSLADWGVFSRDVPDSAIVASIHQDSPGQFLITKLTSPDVGFADARVAYVHQRVGYSPALHGALRAVTMSAKVTVLNTPGPIDVGLALFQQISEDEDALFVGFAGDQTMVGSGETKVVQISGNEFAFTGTGVQFFPNLTNGGQLRFGYVIRIPSTDPSDTPYEVHVDDFTVELECECDRILRDVEMDPANWGTRDAVLFFGNHEIAPPPPVLLRDLPARTSRFIYEVAPIAGSIAEIAHRQTELTHDPATQGVLVGVSFRYRALAHGDGPAPDVIRLIPVIFQDGRPFVQTFGLPQKAILVPGTEVEVTNAGGNRFNFQNPDDGSNPDFSPIGGEMTFGYIIRLEDPKASIEQDQTFDVSVADFEVTLTCLEEG